MLCTGGPGARNDLAYGSNVALFKTAGMLCHCCKIDCDVIKYLLVFSAKIKYSSIPCKTALLFNLLLSIIEKLAPVLQGPLLRKKLEKKKPIH